MGCGCWWLVENKCNTYCKEDRGQPHSAQVDALTCQMRSTQLGTGTQGYQNCDFTCKVAQSYDYFTTINLNHAF